MRHSRLIPDVSHPIDRASPARQRVLLPPVAFAAMAAFRKVLDAHAGGSLQGTRSLEDWAKLVHRTATAVAEVPDANVALQIFLMAASLSSRESSLNFITYDLFEQVRSWFGGVG